MLVFPSEEGAVGRSYTMCVSVYWGGHCGDGGVGVYMPVHPRSAGAAT